MSTVTYITPQNVRFEKELASTGLRVGAFFLDQVILILFLIGLVLFAGFMSQSGFSERYIGYLFFIVYLFYTPIQEILFNGRTAGKAILKIRVRSEDGSKADYMQILARWICRIPDIFLSSGFLALFLIMTTDKSRRLGDFFAGTVVESTADNATVSLRTIQKLGTTNNSEIKYPAIKSLKEEDAVLLKETITRIKKYPNKGHQEAVNQWIRTMEREFGIVNLEKSKLEFLQKLLVDYIVLTR